MIRVREFKLEGYKEPFKMASMTSAQAEEHVNQGKELIRRNVAGEVTPEEWNNRARSTVALSLNRAAVSESHDVVAWTPERVHEELDIPAINELFLKALEISGLKTGEEAAT